MCRCFSSKIYFGREALMAIVNYLASKNLRMPVNLNPSSRLAINGMGRIGRTLFRLLHQKGLIKNLIVVNDIMPKENLIYLLKYDSIRGIFPSDIISTQNGISIDGHEISYSQQNEIKNLP